MALSDETVRASHAGNNSTSTPYPVPFVFLANADVDIMVRTNAGVEPTLVEGTDYTLTGVPGRIRRRARLQLRQRSR
jgi:hypothetical protein